MAFAYKQEWRFDASGQSLDHAINGSTNQEEHAAGGIRVRVIPGAQAVVYAATLRPQIEPLYALLIAEIPNAPMNATSAAEDIFATKKEEQDVEDGSSKTHDNSADSRSLVFFASWDGSDNASSKLAHLIGFSRLFDKTSTGAVIASPLVVDLTLSQEQQEAIQRALFHATQITGEALAQTLLIEKRAKAELEADPSKPVPESNNMRRSLFGTTDFAKKLLAENGYEDEKARVELTMHLSKLRNDDHTPIVFPEGLEVKPVDLNDSKQILALYNVIKVAFGLAPPSFESWKSHYPQQPRFSPELSFVAWDGDEPVAAIAIERILEGEGGGEDEAMKVYATSGKLQAAREEKAKSEAAGVESADQASDNEALAFTGDFDARKERITREATQAYVCGAATKAEYRGKGLASGLLQMAFREAMKTPLQEVVLATDTMNESALRAYARAGMVETKSFSSGWTMTKQILFVREP